MVMDEYTHDFNPRIQDLVERNEEWFEEHEEMAELVLLASWGDLSEQLKGEVEELLDGADRSIEECDDKLENSEKGGE